MKKVQLRFLAPLLVTLLLSQQISAQETDFSGSLTTQAGAGLPNAHDNKGKFLLGQTIFDATLKSYFEESMVYVNGQFVHDAIGSQSTNGFSSFAQEKGNFALHLKEAYLDWKRGMISLRIGRQIAAWGKADSIQVADVLCPKDDSSIIASDYKSSRLGIDAVRISLLTDKSQIDAYFIPFFTPSTLPLAKNNPLRPFLFPETYQGIPINAPSSCYDLDTPEKKLSNSEYALRASAYTSFADFSLYGFYGWDEKPFISFSPKTDANGSLTSIDLSAGYKRMAMLGADAAIPAGDFVFRLEGAFFPNRHIQTSAEYQDNQLKTGGDSDSSQKHHQAIGLLGFDWTPSGWTITAQYVGDFLFNHNDDVDRKNYEHLATLSIEKAVMNENLTITLLEAVDLRALSTSSELEIAYKLTDSICLTAIGDIFLEGPDNKKGMFGVYHDLSCLTLKAKYSF